MTITLQEALVRAIEAERQGATFYTMVANSTPDEQARHFLTEMAREEEEHAAALQALARGELATEVDWSMILDFQAEGDTDEAGDAGTMELREAVELALEAEKHAAYTYACMGSETEGEVQELFTRLALTEQKHADLLTALLQRLDAEAQPS